MLHFREPRRFTPEEYLMLEERSDRKSEFHQGEIFLMSGGTLEHNLLVANVIGILHAQLRGHTCRVFPSDLRLYARSHQIFTYPDALVICGAPVMLNDRRDTVTDAALIVEVLSPSTADYDRGEKFRAYQSLPGFSDYLLIAQHDMLVEHHTREAPGRWLASEHRGAHEVIKPRSVAVELPLSDIYAGVIPPTSTEEPRTDRV